MLELITAFSGSQIIIFVVMLVLAIKGCWDIVDYFKTKYEKKFNKDYSAIEKEKELEKHYEESIARHQENLTLINNLDKKLDEWRNTVNNKLDMFEKDLNMLIESDKNDIKQSIVRDYHTFTKKGWIDDFSLDTILLRYTDYKKEGGNTYIDTLVSELQKLPKTPPQ